MSFDRKTFDPKGNHQDHAYLNSLRVMGNARAYALKTRSRGAKLTKYMGTGMRELCDIFNTNDSLLDIGCGDSPDTYIARRDYGLEVASLDLFPPSRRELLTGFVQGDAVEGLPFADDSFDHILCQAMIDLVKPVERVKLYLETWRVLKNGWGQFYVTFQTLSKGWGFDLKQEIETLKQIGFEHTYGGCFMKGYGDSESCYGRTSLYQRGDRVIEISDDPLTIKPRIGTVYGRGKTDYDFIKIRVDGYPHLIDESINSWRIISKDNLIQRGAYL